jgi:translation initiation factor 2 alpha subunit (eIF-2alpha)
MLHVSNIPGLWIRDIRKSFKKGQIIVCKILKTDHVAELTLKGISKYEKEKRIKEFGRERKTIRVFERICKEFKINPKKVKEAIEKLKEEYGSLFDATKKIREGEDLELGKEFDKVIERLKTSEKEYEFKGVLKLNSNEGNGVELIKESLKEFKNADVSYLGSSNFLIKLKTKNPKKGEKILQKEAENVILKIKSLKGSGEFKINS